MVVVVTVDVGVVVVHGRLAERRSGSPSCRKSRDLRAMVAKMSRYAVTMVMSGMTYISSSETVL